MRGLYINCDDSNIPASVDLAKKYSKTFVFPKEIGRGQVTYCPKEWNKVPSVEFKNNTFVVYGWFIYKNERNNLEKLSVDIVENGVDVVNSIDAGTFLIYWWDGTKAQIIVDPLGMSTHYVDLRNEKLKIAPSVKVLQNDSVHPVNPLLKSVLDKKQHLFGDYTIYDGIERLTPGCVYESGHKYIYFALSNSQLLPFEEIGQEINVLASFWTQKEKVLPISSGLDSRFILANTLFDNGFTYGPKDSPELNIAGQFKDDFSDYYAYDFCAPPLYENELEVNNEMSFGVLNPIERLLANYIHVKQRFYRVNVFFDGYCGDVFQRGTFLNFKGVEAELFKMFPWIYRLLNWDAEKILRKRHSVLSDDEFSMLYQDFLTKTNELKLDNGQKVTYYEFLYGRGGRFAIFGSNILSTQLFTVVSPFAHRKIFNTLIHQNFYDGIMYKTMKKLWSKVPEKYTNIKVESGYTPKTNIYLIPFIQIIYRLMFHIIPSRANYGVKMRRDKKRAERTNNVSGS